MIKIVKAGVWLYVLTVLMGLDVKAQDVNADLYRINKAYQNRDHIYLEMKVNAYRTWTDRNPYEQKEGVIMKSNVRKYTSIGDITMILNNSYSVTVDHAGKKILVLPASVNSQQASGDLLMPRLDTVLLKVCRKIEFFKEPGGSHGYEFTMKEGNEYDRIRISFSPKTYLIRQIIFYYNEEHEEKGSGVKKKPRLEITYTKTEFPGKMNDQEFTYDKYLVLEKGRLVCRSQYKNYQLINQLPKK